MKAAQKIVNKLINENIFPLSVIRGLLLFCFHYSLIKHHDALF